MERNGKVEPTFVGTTGENFPLLGGLFPGGRPSCSLLPSAMLRRRAHQHQTAAAMFREKLKKYPSPPPPPPPLPPPPALLLLPLCHTHSCAQASARVDARRRRQRRSAFRFIFVRLKKPVRSRFFFLTPPLWAERSPSAFFWLPEAFWCG